MTFARVAAKRFLICYMKTIQLVSTCCCLSISWILNLFKDTSHSVVSTVSIILLHCAVISVILITLRKCMQWIQAQNPHVTWTKSRLTRIKNWCLWMLNSSVDSKSSEWSFMLSGGKARKITSLGHTFSSTAHIFSNSATLQVQVHWPLSTIFIITSSGTGWLITALLSSVLFMMSMDLLHF